MTLELRLNEEMIAAVRQTPARPDALCACTEGAPAAADALVLPLAGDYQYAVK